MGLVTEHYYTSQGRQRAVFLRPEDGDVRFGLETLEGDDGVIEVCFDSQDALRKGQGRWEVFGGGLGGCVSGATALRVQVVRTDGWVKFVVQRNGETLENGR